MLKKYIATVNNTQYEVVLEEVDANTVFNTASAPAAAPAPQAAPAAPAKAAEPAPAAAPAAAPADGTKVTAPLPGTVLKINVSVGASVKEGDALCVLEAMKMENDIPAPVSGTVKSIAVAQGASVNTGDLLVVIG